MVYHVSKSGSDQNDGSECAPFLTIQKAADTAMAGDEVVIHEGIYREWINPKRGGVNDCCRITYRSADGERPIIKGSETASDWIKVKQDVWQTSVSNNLFGGFNPFAEKVFGDWFADPQKYDVHLGCVYLNGVALFEARNEAELFTPPLRIKSELPTWGDREEPVLKSEESLRVWTAEVFPEKTVIRANFGDVDPNRALVEINVRPCCFYPKRNNIDYITIRGLEFCHAATQWAPPSANQVGMVGPNWAKGWIIEDNLLHDSKCCAISLGKDAVTGDNAYTHFKKKPDYLYQMEAVFKALDKGWSKEQVGSHIVRRNTIYDCGQTGIVGHMDCVFSQIYDNDISYIATRHEFFGHEIAGIKLHAAIDVQIYHNHIHHCTLGTWLDWQAQGTRVSSNVYDHNARDLFVEVTHGPYLIDNNLFTSPYSLDNASEGGAFVHNLFCGIINLCFRPDRPTPYHMPHSTKVMGVLWIAGLDDRWLQNIFVGGDETGMHYGTDSCNGASRTLGEYLERQKDYTYDYLQGYRDPIQPVYIQRNVYLRGAKAWEHEKDAVFFPNYDPLISVEDDGNGLVLNITLPETMDNTKNCQITTSILGSARVTEECYEAPDGSAVCVDSDLMNNPLSATPMAGPLQMLHGGKNCVALGHFGCVISRKKSK